ncbi:interferon-inducible GTPase 5-like [Cololabis saira]|uniref:interferon-inducible GTPase 5-like n=1 Tax=Cololabis saira TaxID=129043 RepID=UPI002AD3B4A4|nr:interferon-inducible GTPase 5-like [Cololabis saira]
MDSKGLQKLKELMNTDPAAAAEKIKDHVEKENKIPLNIGITGESGSGKSSFVNAFRGMSNADEGAAPTGCVETTKHVTAYPHPRYPHMVLWDLPGVGTTNFPVDKYLELVAFKKFDFFIIISHTRFRENDVKLAQAMKKMGKKFYFVRSKIDNDLRSEARSKRDFSAEKTLKQVRGNCIQGLQKEGFESLQVFLISSFDVNLHDFRLLHETLERELPAHKKLALLLAVPNISLEVINKKKEAFQNNIKYYAAASAAVAAVPLPGYSAGVDLKLMVTVIKQYINGFRLDVTSLQRLSANAGVQFNDLKVVNTDLLRKLMLSVWFLLESMVAEEAFRLLPIFGIPATKSLSFTTTYKALNYFLNVLADDARRRHKELWG